MGPPEGDQDFLKKSSCLKQLIFSAEKMKSPEEISAPAGARSAKNPSADLDALAKKYVACWYG